MRCAKARCVTRHRDETGASGHLVLQLPCRLAYKLLQTV